MVHIGRGVELTLDPDLTPANAVLGARVTIDRMRFVGLGSVVGACAVLCASNYCRDWALRNGRPKMVGKVVGVMADRPMYILLTQPKLKNADRPRRESRANRVEAGLVPFVLIEPARLECPECPGPNVGEIIVEP